MKTEEIIEGNKLIAEFLGYRVYDKWYPRNHGIGIEPISKECIVEKCKYNSSWDWLMPVVIHINKMKKMININFWSDFPTVECKIYNWGLGEPQQTAECENPLEAVWQAVVEFIKFYNQNKSQS